jgi:hypothetical protein
MRRRRSRWGVKVESNVGCRAVHSSSSLIGRRGSGRIGYLRGKRLWLTATSSRRGLRSNSSAGAYCHHYQQQQPPQQQLRMMKTLVLTVQQKALTPRVLGVSHLKKRRKMAIPTSVPSGLRPSADL